MKKVSAGVGIMILKENRILLGLRNSDPKKASSDLHGEGTWTFPGGKIDFGESIYKAGIREVKEETGLVVLDVELMCINNNISEDSQYFTFGLKTNQYKGIPAIEEPDEIIEWKWFEFDKLPENLYFPTKKMIEMYRKNRFIDIKEN